MTDRELLELAAKAMGDSVVWGGTWNVGGELIDCTDIPYLGSGQPDENDVYWNPLEDDGDALRLAVKLRIPVVWRSHDEWGSRQQATECGVLRDPKNSEKYPNIVPHNDDPYAATRRAIVRAAAEIGRNMK